MSVFTNPASAAADAADEYVNALLSLLGDRDPLEVLRATPKQVRSKVDSVDEARLRRPEAPGKWSALSVVQHLADSDLVWGWRLRLIIAHDRPTLTGYDQDAWANNLGYNEVPVSEALSQMEILRTVNLRLLERLDDDQFARVGVHSERGEESLTYLLPLYAGHDLVHLAQLDRILSRL